MPTRKPAEDRRSDGTEPDVGVLKRPEEVSQQERKLREILDLVPDQITVFAADGTPLYSNRVSLDYFAMTTEELRESVTDPRRTFRRFAHPEDVETFVAAWERGFAGTAPWETEVRFRRGDGEYRWFLVARSRSATTKDAPSVGTTRPPTSTIGRKPKTRSASRKPSCERPSMWSRIKSWSSQPTGRPSTPISPCWTTTR